MNINPKIHNTDIFAKLTKFSRENFLYNLKGLYENITG